MKKKVVAITTIALLSSSLGTGALANTYQVQKGDTLTKIAKNHNTSVAEIKTLNKLASDNIFINQTLKVAASPVAPTPAVKPAPPKVVKPTTTEYTVVSGDSLSKIASKHNITLSDLMKWNHLDHYVIFPGQKLKVKSVAAVQTKPEPVKTPQPTKPSNLSEYIVQKGDTLGHISTQFNLTVEDLKSLNKLNSNLIYVGQKLAIVPVEESNSVTNIPPTVTNEAPVDSELVDKLISQAKEWIGVPYAWAGTSLSGFDCSGFIYFAFNAVGKELSRQSTDGYYSRSYYVDSPQIGDLVFFENTYKAGISHMGIYLGNNEFIHASASKGVTISSLNEAYYQQRFDGFKRFY